jgi:hypothetical protein
MPCYSCENHGLSKKYLPGVGAAYLKTNLIDGEWQFFIMSQPFDFESITIYGSYHLSGEEGDDEDFPAGAVSEPPSPTLLLIS